MLSKRSRGFMLASIAACTYGMNPLFTLPLYSAGMTADAVLFYRYLFAIPIVAVMMLARGRSFRVSLKQVPLLIVMGLVMAFSSLGLFLSYNYMDAGIASTLLFVYPIMVAVMMTFIFHERISKLTILCIIGALVGIGLLFKGSDGATLSLAGTTLVFLSSLSYAVYIVAINRTSLSRVPTLTVTFFVLLFGLSLFAVRLMWTGSLPTPPIDLPMLWGCLLALALFPTAISFLCTTAAINDIGSTPTAILGALEPVTAVFFGVVVFGEKLSLQDVAGLILIITAVTGVVASPVLPKSLTAVRRLFPRRLRKSRRIVKNVCKRSKKSIFAEKGNEDGKEPLHGVGGMSSAGRDG